MKELFHLAQEYLEWYNYINDSKTIHKDLFKYNERCFIKVSV